MILGKRILFYETLVSDKMILGKHLLLYEASTFHQI